MPKLATWIKGRPLTRDRPGLLLVHEQQDVVRPVRHVEVALARVPLSDETRRRLMASVLRRVESVLRRAEEDERCE